MKYCSEGGGDKPLQCHIHIKRAEVNRRFNQSQKEEIKSTVVIMKLLIHVMEGFEGTVRKCKHMYRKKNTETAKREREERDEKLET
jgi:hypothetical protein